LGEVPPSIIGENFDETTPLDELSAMSKSLALHELALDAPLLLPPEPTKEGQFSSLVANPAHKQIFPPLHLTVGKNPRIAY